MTFAQAIRLLRYFKQLVMAFLGGGIINNLLVHGPPGAGLWGMADDVIMILLKGTFEFSFWEGQALSVFYLELRKIIEDGEQYYQMSDRERAVVRRYVRQEYPDHIYLYGRIDVEDVINLFWSGYVVARSAPAQSVFQAVSDIFELVPEIEEVALVA